jgi:uncharacterized protein (DUF111 family)
MKRSDIGMDEEEIIEQLEDLAQRLGIKVRYEELKKEGVFSPGGLCRVKDEDILIVNSKASVQDKMQVLAKAVTSFDLGGVYMRPGLREFLLRESSPNKGD